jgi:predicted ArsR family transcriptional regulator
MVTMNNSLDAAVAAVATLDEPTRRRLYDHVIRQPQPVSRDELAAALGLPRATAAFHLERLAAEGLLDVVHQRRTGRSGPGAGRPTKLYRRAPRQVTVSLPERRYDLAGHLLAAALEEAEHSGEPPRTVLNRRAYRLGHKLGQAAHTAEPRGEDRTAALEVLEAHGFEPRTEGAEVVLGNCPFHTLAQEHTDLVCGMNLHLVDGLLHRLDRTGLCVRLSPAPGSCCVRLEPTG